MPGRTDSRLRMVGILMVFVVFATAAGVRLGYWQVVAAPELAATALTRMSAPEEIRMARAPIVDRNGKTLARTVTLDRLVAYPNIIDAEDRQSIVDELTRLLELSAQEREGYLAKLSVADDQWTWLARRLSEKESAAVGLARANGDLPGIGLEPVDVRRYPGSGGQSGTTLASHLIGFVAGDGRGATGVERLYDERLVTEVPGHGDLASLPGAAIDLGEADAPPLQLTIDHKLQSQLEKELSSARLTTGAKSVSAVIMNPHTGEVLASASSPGYDANDYAKVAADRMSRLRDPVVSEVFEPGSVMKIFTATAALDNGVVTPQTKINDSAKLEFYKKTIHNSDWKGKGLISVKDVIGYSRNVATARIAARLAPQSHQAAARKLFAEWDKVGLVGKTGIDIAGEEAGIWCDPSEGCRWAEVDLANRAFGQGVGVTLLQLANGVSTIVNGGYRVQPHVVADSEAAKVEPWRVLKGKIARQARDILVHVTGAVPWYAQGALIPGYMIGGKTGTAQIWDSRKDRWKDDIFNHNFVGFVGGNKPEVVIALRIEEPKAKIRGQGIVEIKIESYELFQNIAKGAIKILGIKRSKDKNAGLPIIGTQAARQLTPGRTRQTRQDAAPRRDRSTSKRGQDGAKVDKKKRSKDDAASFEAASDEGTTRSDGSEP